MTPARRERLRRLVRHTAALTLVTLAGGVVAASAVVRVNGMYGDELFSLLLFLTSFISCSAWLIAFPIWLFAVSGHRHEARP